MSSAARRVRQAVLGLLPGDRREALRDRRRRVLHARDELRSLPPVELRRRVHGDDDLDGFLSVGLRTAVDVRTAAVRAGADPMGELAVLDFGAGCGRTLRWMPWLLPSARLFGTDVDAEAIAWLRDAMPAATVAVNGRRPPLTLAGPFDVAYAVSVFTHLDEDDQMRWLEALRDALRPGGLLVLSLHGPDALPSIPDEAARRIEADGFAFITGEQWRGVFPSWYQTAVHTPAWVRRRFGEVLDVVAHEPRALNGHHDLVTLRRP